MGTPVNGPSRKPSFLWQGVLILAPVLVLAGIGGYALWKDQRLAIREAEGRALLLAELPRLEVEAERVRQNLGVDLQRPLLRLIRSLA